MGYGPLLGLKAGVRLLEGAEGPAGVEEPGNRRLSLGSGGGRMGAFLRALAEGGRTEEALCGSGSREALDRRYVLARLEGEGWITYGLAQAGRPRATLEPLTREFRFRAAGAGGPCRLSRFAWIRRLEDGTPVLESPLGLGRVQFHAPEVLAWSACLAHPRTPEDLARETGLTPGEAHTFVALLVAAGAAAPCGEGDLLPEDRDPALRQWEFHDLLFHSRSRRGRHEGATGGTCRFLGRLDPLPALRPALPDPGIPLPEPLPPARRDPGFFGVLAHRRSLREPGAEPLTLDQLGAFLHHVARIRAVAPPDAGRGLPCETAAGPCPGGGGLREIELYLSVARCAGLAPGFYHYAAGRHILEPWPDPGAASPELLRQAQASLGASAVPDVLFTLAARVQRVSWKYEGIAYALILKDAGVLFQQMYLVATALGLAPCAIGAGDTQLFARASGLDFTRETSVGEFALSGRPSSEAAGS